MFDVCVSFYPRVCVDVHKSLLNFPLPPSSFLPAQIQHFACFLLVLFYFIFFALQNCHDRIQELFSDKIYLIGIAALVVAVIMVRTKTKKNLPCNTVSISNTTTWTYSSEPTFIFIDYCRL